VLEFEPASPSSESVVSVLDVTGRTIDRLRPGTSPPGSYRIVWDITDRHGRRVPAGVYFLRLEADGQTSIARVTVID